ncbi:hypothetical protein C8R41DRAFT_870905 [Lentinula lateritia]|uniref:Uncharacterized protein n=1 Tax=Lentinula lateritia TaxID=40482 RepID=A0ABQ8V1V5_9AGAR|nr:hypothetical protein C8R41DRAFT_870905 [Lentinula lateritia]
MVILISSSHHHHQHPRKRKIMKEKERKIHTRQLFGDNDDDNDGDVGGGDEDDSDDDDKDGNEEDEEIGEDGKDESGPNINVRVVPRFVGRVNGVRVPAEVGHGDARVERVDPKAGRVDPKAGRVDAEEEREDVKAGDAAEPSITPPVITRVSPAWYLYRHTWRGGDTWRGGLLEWRRWWKWEGEGEGRRWEGMEDSRKEEEEESLCGGTYTAGDDLIMGCVEDEDEREVIEYSDISERWDVGVGVVYSILILVLIMIMLVVNVVVNINVHPIPEHQKPRQLNCTRNYIHVVLPIHIHIPTSQGSRYRNQQKLHLRACSATVGGYGYVEWVDEGIPFYGFGWAVGVEWNGIALRYKSRRESTKLKSDF